MKKRCYLVLIALFVTCSLLSAQQVDQSELYEELLPLYEAEEYDVVLGKIWEVPNPLEADLMVLAGRSHHRLFHYDSAAFYFTSSLLFESLSIDRRVRLYIGLAMIYEKKNKVKLTGEVIDSALELVSNVSDKNLISILNFYTIQTDQKTEIEYRLAKQGEILDKINIELEYLIPMYATFINNLFSERKFNLANKYLVTYNLLSKRTQFTNAQKAELALYNAFYNYRIGAIEKSIQFFENDLFNFVVDKETDWARYYLMEYYRISCLLYSTLRDNKKVVKNYKKFLQIAPDFLSEDHGKVAESYRGLSFAYAALGNKVLESKYRDLAVAIYKRQDSEIEMIWGYTEEANALFEKGDFSNALKTLQYIVNFESSYNYIKGSQAQALYLLGKIYFEKDSLQHARSHLEKAIAVEKEAFGKDFNHIVVKKLYVKVLYALKKEKLAAQVYREMFQQRNLYEQVNVGTKLGLLNDYIDRVITEGYYDSAENSIDKIRSHNPAIGQALGSSKLNDEYVRTLYYESLIYFNRSEDNLDSGLFVPYKYIANAVKTIGLNRKTYRPDADRIAQFETEKKVFERGIQLAHLLYEKTGEQQYLDDLFSFIESGKSNQLLESLNRNLAIQKTQIPDSVLLNVNNLRQQATYLESVITQLEQKKDRSPQDSTNLVGYKTRLASNRSYFNEAILQLEQDFPAYYDINYNQQLASIPSIQGKLKENEALLQYAFAEEDLYLVLVTKNRAEVQKLENVSLDMVNGFQKILQPEFFTADEQEGYGQFVAQSATLYQKLLEPALSDMGSKITKLHIIPDRHLNFLPFELFIKAGEGESTELDYASLDYAGLNYDISYGYSVSVLEKQLDRQGQKRSFEGNLLAVAPSYGDFLESEEQLAALGKFRDDFTELSFNKEEVNQISDFFETTALKGKAASEKAFVERIGSYDIVHLAMHAFVDNEEPDKSKLVFSDVDGEETDNFLHNFEIYNLSLNTRMAVLSACNTGYGDLKTGEGVMSVARAFTYAGAESVVTSHWRVDDRASSILMKYFYQHLSQGMTKDAALRQAKLKYLQQASPNTSHPFYWNNFVILGDPAPLVIKTPVYWYWLGAVALLLSIMAFFYVKRSRGRVGVG